MVSSLQSLRSCRRGFSLVEFCIALAVLAIISSLTVPAVARTLARQRVVAAAQDLAADIAQARQEASSRGLPMHLEVQTGADWCWAVTRHAGCGCGATNHTVSSKVITQANGCQLKVIGPADYPGVTLSAASSLRLDADGTADHSVAATLQAGDTRVQVEVGPLGRARLCAPQGAVSGMRHC